MDLFVISVLLILILCQQAFIVMAVSEQVRILRLGEARIHAGEEMQRKMEKWANPDEMDVVITLTYHRNHWQWTLFDHEPDHQSGKTVGVSMPYAMAEADTAWEATTDAMNSLIGWQHDHPLAIVTVRCALSEGSSLDTDSTSKTYIEEVAAGTYL